VSRRLVLYVGSNVAVAIVLLALFPLVLLLLTGLYLFVLPHVSKSRSG